MGNLIAISCSFLVPRVAKAGKGETDGGEGGEGESDVMEKRRTVSR